MCLVWQSMAQARQHWDNSDSLYLFLLIFSYVPPCDYRIYNVGAETPNNVFIEPIHLLTHNSQPSCDMSNINIHEADWVLLLWWIYSIINLLISAAILFSLKAFWIHTNSFSPTYKEGGWPLWLLNSLRPSRRVHPECVLFDAARPLGMARSKSIWYCIKRMPRECWRHSLVERWGKRQSERQAARCRQCREMGVKGMKTYKWKSILEGRKA